MIRALDPVNDAAACDAIVRGLPDWFGLEEGIAACALAVRTHDGLVAVDGDEVTGFLTYEHADHDGAWEITWIAVRAARRGHGIGGELVSALAATLPQNGTVRVKTVSDREGDPGPEYNATRGFYLSQGFSPVAELDIWGPDNPCQVLARPVALPRA